MAAWHARNINAARHAASDRAKAAAWPATASNIKRGNAARNIINLSASTQLSGSAWRGNGISMPAAIISAP